MAKYYSEIGRWGTIQLVPSKFQIDAEGNRHFVPGLNLKLFPAWAGNTEIPQGPEIINTEERAFRETVEGFWGSEWQAKFDDWLKRVGTPKYGFKPGDPMPKRVVRPRMTQADLEAFNEFQANRNKPTVKVEEPTAAQPVIHGGRGVSNKR